MQVYMPFNMIIMGYELEISITGNYDSNSPVFTTDFLAQIVSGHLWQNRKAFLSSAESEILFPKWTNNSDGDERLLEPVDPLLLKSVFYKIGQYLEKNQTILPLVHSLSCNKSELEQIDNYAFGSFGELIIKNSKCWVQGDTYFYDEYNDKGLRQKFNIRNHPYEPDDIDLWMDVKSEIEIDGKLYYMRTITKFQQFEESIKDVIACCNTAIEQNKNIYWLIS
jgi:hypothetical protein